MNFVYDPLYQFLINVLLTITTTFATINKSIEILTEIRSII